MRVLTSIATMNEQGDGEYQALVDVLGNAQVTEHLHEIQAGDVVFPRFRAIPFGDLLQKGVEHAGAELINSFHQHRNIADSATWSHLLDGSDGNDALSPKQYGIDDIRHLPEGEWFVKGETNSLKNQWLNATFAPSTRDLGRVVSNFMADSYVGSQSVVIKPFQHYRKLATGVNGAPVFHERRAFILDGKVVSDGFYWSNWKEEVGEIEYDKFQYLNTLDEAARRVQHLARFLVIDLAEYPDGSWGVVELNDGCMSGLSDNDPRVLWANVKEAMSKPSRPYLI